MIKCHNPYYTITVKKIAILASGSGSNAENIAKYFNGKGYAEVSFIIANNPNAYVIERAKRLGIECAVVTKAEFMEADGIIAMLKEREIDFVVLAGFLLLVPAKLIQAYPGRIVNIHPALLPKHGGKGMYGDRVHKAVVECGDTESGITIHLIDEQYDKGTTFFQAKCPVLPTDTPDDVATKVHALEYEHFPHVIEEILHTLD
ncbi:MAG: phosphoribosylglycinamide formyltransferase [Bacteroidaceae bacterium]|nr:phosphoribosylglycinamide formyltransferase [Bacteroidaceae bacterium]